jgi:hypothetical protein
MGMTTMKNLPIVIIAGSIFLLFVMNLGDVSSSSLNDDISVNFMGAFVFVTNVGHEPVTVLDVDINDRQECKPTNAATGKKAGQPYRLKVGDYIAWNGPCPIVRALIKTDHGNATYAND